MKEEKEREQKTGIGSLNVFIINCPWQEGRDFPRGSERSSGKAM